TLQGQKEGVTSVCFSPDGTQLVTASVDETAKVWDARVGTSLREFQGHTGRVSSVSFSPDGTRLVYGSEDRTARARGGGAGTQLLTLQGHAGAVVSVSFSPDGTRIVTGGGHRVPPGQATPGEVKVWDARTGTSLLDLPGHTGLVGSVSYSSDGTRIVSGS